MTQPKLLSNPSRRAKPFQALEIPPRLHPGIFGGIDRLREEAQQLTTENESLSQELA